ncbi:unnamed protein product, partial [Staurois parvus]
ITCQHPVIAKYYCWRRDLCINNTHLSLVSSCTLLFMALHSTHTAHNVKQHTVNPSIAHMLTPSCPVSLVQF